VPSADLPIRRVRVVGSSGAGKTTLARELAGRLGVRHVELDEVFWDANWTKRDRETAREGIRAFLASPAGADGWVMCGNWSSGHQGLLDDTDTFVWLDYPRLLVMSRLVRRTFRRMITREELWHGNREDPRNLLTRDGERNVLVWSWTNHHAMRERYGSVEREGKVRVVRLRSPRAARRWLDSIGT
jgi:adenylate kinase family enzyme